jgi:hypothetical protein
MRWQCDDGRASTMSSCNASVIEDRRRQTSGAWGLWGHPFIGFGKEVRRWMTGGGAVYWLPT